MTAWAHRRHRLPFREARVNPPQTIFCTTITGLNQCIRYKLAAIKLCTPSKEHLEKHYEDLSEKPFFKGLVTYMLSGPICAMVWEGRDAVKTGRSMRSRQSYSQGFPMADHTLALLGATNPLASAPGTIRGDYAIVRPPLPSTSLSYPRNEQPTNHPSKRTSAATSATAPTASRTPRRKSRCGSTRAR